MSAINGSMLPTPASPSSPDGVELFGEDLRVVSLIERKFKALEQLVFVLKKKVLMYESNEDLCDRYVCMYVCMYVYVHAKHWSSLCLC